MTNARVSAIGAVAALMAAMMLWVGCEESPTNITIQVSPNSVETTNWVVVTFVASLTNVTTNASDRALHHPLEWELSDLALGRLLETVGDSAVYETTAGPGVQTITVRDQAGLEGVAVVAQSVE